MKRINQQRDLKSRRGKRGVLSMELVLTLPILFFLLLAIFEFMMLFYSRSLLVEASRIGARKAAISGVTEEDIAVEIERVLSPQLQKGIQINVDFGEWSGDVVTVALTVPMTSASPDLMWPIGFGLTGRNLYSETRMIRE
jgi:hypothetical protein